MITVMPITPKEAAANVTHSKVPDQVIEAVNTLLSEKYDGTGPVNIGVGKIIVLAKRFLTRDRKQIPYDHQFLDWGLLDIGPLFRKRGWVVDRVHQGDDHYGHFTFDADPPT